MGGGAGGGGSGGTSEGGGGGSGEAGTRYRCASLWGHWAGAERPTGKAAFVPDTVFQAELH